MSWVALGVNTMLPNVIKAGTSAVNAVKGSKGVTNGLSKKISTQKQARHIAGTAKTTLNHQSSIFICV